MRRCVLTVPLVSAFSSTRRLSMKAEEKYLFDLNGYLLVRGVLSEPELKALHSAIDEHAHEAVSRSSMALRNAGAGAFGDKGARRDLGGMLAWQTPGFRELLAHPKLAPYLTALCGEGYRLDHQPLVLLQDAGSEGFALHGGPLSGDDGVPQGVFNPELQYRCVNGQPWTSLLAMAVHLVDAPEGAGGFCVVRGSHKANFAVPKDFASGRSAEFAQEFVEQPVTSAGDVLFFSEATVHGAKPWRMDYERRLALYRFSPPNFAYGRAYLNDWGGPNVLDKCSPAQRAVLEPPFAPRLERLLTTAHGDDGPPPARKLRAQEKKDHDKMVFKTDFF